MDFKYKSQAEITAMTDAEREKYAADKRVYEAELATKAAKDEAEKVKTDLETQLVSQAKVLNDRMDEFEAGKEAKKDEFAGLDMMGRIAKAISDKEEEFKAYRTGAPAITIKAPALMTTATSLTGTGVITYSGNAAILPSAPLNMRDLIPIVRSETGTYATYAETGGEGTVDHQLSEGVSEGVKKPFLDIDFTELRTVTRVIAGTVDFSKQLTRNLPFLQGTLARILTRKFYEKENRYLYDTLAAAATGGSAPAADTIAVQNLIGYVMAAFDANFVPSYIVIKGADYGTIAQTNIMNSPFGLVFNQATGRSEIAGIPVIVAPWGVAGKALIFDRDYVELVVTEDITIRFSEENKDNFEKNVITARIEAQEELNVIYKQSAIYQDLAGAITPPEEPE